MTIPMSKVKLRMYMGDVEIPVEDAYATTEKPSATSEALAAAVSERFDREISAAMGRQIEQPKQPLFSFSFPADAENLEYFRSAYGTRPQHQGNEIADLGGAAMRLFSVSLTALRAVREEPGVATVEVVSIARDRNGTEPVQFTFRKGFPTALWDHKDRSVRLRCIRQAVREWLMHELDENLYLDGERIFDPHVTFDHIPLDPELARTLTFAR